MESTGGKELPRRFHCGNGAAERFISVGMRMSYRVTRTIRHRLIPGKEAPRPVRASTLPSLAGILPFALQFRYVRHYIDEHPPELLE